MASLEIKNIKNSGLFALFLCIVLLSSTAFLQYYSDILKRNSMQLPTTIIPARAIRAIDLGLHSAAASLAWINTIQNLVNYGEKLPLAFKNLNDTDPKFSFPYAFGTLVLPAFGFTDEALEIGKDGIRRADSDWRIPYYLATTYHIYLKDRENASLYFNLAANTPNVLEQVKIIAARYGTSADHRSETKAIWQSIYETSKDEVIKENAMKSIVQIEIMELLEKAVAIYKQKYGLYPASLDELVTKKIVKSIPENPLGVTLSLDKNGKIIIE